MGSCIQCIVCNALWSHFIYPFSSILPPTHVLLPFPPRIISLPPPSVSLIFSAADKEVEDYYTRKRHLPDLAARGTLPLHVIKMSQEQVGMYAIASQIRDSKQVHIIPICFLM